MQSRPGLRYAILHPIDPNCDGGECHSKILILARKVLI